MAFSRTFDAALMMAALAHRGQVRKGTRVPYVMHPFHVSVLLSRFGYREPLTIAALLHDVLEDMRFDDVELQRDLALTFPQWEWPQDASLADFRSALRGFVQTTFGDDVLRLIDAVTEEKNDGRAEPPWLERRQKQLAHLGAAAADEAVLKAADALHNVSSVVEDVRSGRGTLEGRFKATPDQTLWYYQSVAFLARHRTDGAAICDALDKAVYELEQVIQR